MRTWAPIALVLVVSVLPSASQAKDFRALVLVGQAGASVTVRADSRVIESFFDWGSPLNRGRAQTRAAARGPYALLYVLAAGGLPGIPGRFYEQTQAACFGIGPEPPSPCFRPNRTLRRLLLPARRLTGFRGPTTHLERLAPGHRNLNLRTAIELALARHASARPGRAPAACLHFRAAWAGPEAGQRPARLCLGPRGVHARGRLYPLGRGVWEFARANAPYWQRLGSAVELVPLAEKRVRLCRRAVLLRPACPRRVPRVRAAYLAHLYRDGSGRNTLAIFNLERGGEDPQRPTLNRPPRMAHLVMAGGAVWRTAPLRSGRIETMRLTDGLLRRARDRTISFGSTRWAGHRGRLYLAASYPHGGMLGNHLVFVWYERGAHRLVSLHAWEPLTEARATLRAIVAGAGPR